MKKWLKRPNSTPFGQSPGGEGGPSGIRYWACAVPLFKKRLLTAGVVGEIVAFVQLSVAFVAFA
jgi:hypothetical protein